MSLSEVSKLERLLCVVQKVARAWSFSMLLGEKVGGVLCMNLEFIFRTPEIMLQDFVLCGTL